MRLTSCVSKCNACGGRVVGSAPLCGPCYRIDGELEEMYQREREREFGAIYCLPVKRPEQPRVDCGIVAFQPMDSGLSAGDVMAIVGLIAVIAWVVWS